METVKGFKDIIGEEALKREKIREIIVRAFKNYGFEPAETPVVEYEEFVRGRNISDEAVSDIFKMQDKGKRSLALRYELTFQLERIAKNKKLPYKVYQIGPVFRDEPASLNRFRQFTQCDADVVGSTIRDEAEIIALSGDILKTLGINAVISINNRKLLNEILDKEGIKKKQEVIREIDKLDKLTEKEVKANLKNYDADKLVALFKKTESYFTKYAAYKEVAELKKYCSYFNVKARFQPSLARGLSYYAGNVFEIKTDSMKETLIAGGTYSVNGIQSTGISIGLERVSQLARVDISEKKVLIINISKEREAVRLAEKLRKEDIATAILDKVTKGLEYANSYNAPYVIFIGEQETKIKKYKLRDMKTGKESLLNETELIKELKK